MKEERYLAIRHSTIRKANEIIQKSRFSLSVQQQKIMLYLISQISPKDKEFKKYEFSIAEFCKVCGIAYNGRSYRDLQNSIQELHDKSMWIIHEDGTRSLLAWINEAEIAPGTGTVTIRLNEAMKPYLLQLKENFTTYELLWTLNFRSKYTIRLYEYIKCIHFHELEVYKRRCTVDELKRLLDAETYDKYRDFKRRVLIPSVGEINECSDKNLAFEEVTRGRKVIAVEFTISTKDTFESLRLKSDIEKKFGLDQMTLYEILEEKGLV